MNSIASSIQKIQENILQTAQGCGRDPSSIQLIAVSKTQPLAAILEAHRAGLRVFGENRVQEAEEKIAELSDLQMEWHLIGHLQSNKVKKAFPLFSLIHSVDSPKLIADLEMEAVRRDRTVAILLQLNLSGEESKFGAGEGELENLLASMQKAPHLHCRGLMTIPPFVDNPEEVRPFFRQLRKLGEKYQSDLLQSGGKMILSMGMTHDFQVAIEEGATMVRIGTAIFGNRT